MSTDPTSLAQRLREVAARAFPQDPVNPDDTETVVGWELVSTTEQARSEEINLPEMYASPELGSVSVVADAVVVAVLRELAAGATPSEPGGVRMIKVGHHRFGLGPWEREGLRMLADSIEKGVE